MMEIIMDVLTHILLLSTVAVNAVSGIPLWNWVLGVPMATDTIALTHNNTLSASSGEMDEIFGHKSDGLLTRQHRHHHGQGLYCKNDHHCGRRRFCDFHYGICRRQRKDGEQCREDKQCFRNSECVFGLCRKKLKLGMIGAKCQNDSDCDSNSCCARNHGEMICKSRLPLGHKCYVPNGGLEYSINEMCPCQEGLYCSHNHFKQSDLSPTSRSWSLLRSNGEVNSMKCAPFPVESFIKIA